MLKRLAYDVAMGVGLIAASPILAARLARGRYRATLKARLGLGRDWLPPRPAAGGVWVHALSVGEVGTALPLVEALAKRFPERAMILSVATSQGLAVARERLAGNGRILLFTRPLDLPWAVNLVLDHLRPGVFCLVEGDIWPGWQWSMAERGIPRILVNSRVSPRTFKGYRRLGPLAREMLAGFQRILAQTGVDRDRLAAVGVGPERLAVGGNLKFDTAPPLLSEAEKRELALELGLVGRRVVVAGSTHPGEEEPVLEAFAALARDREGLTLLLAPREVHRGQELARLIRRKGMKAGLLSEGAPPPGAGVVILDRLGVLARAYALGQASFVGGSFTPVGGHNLLEPAAQGVPVFFGLHTHNFLEMARLLEENGGGFRVADGGELREAWRRVLDDAAAREKMGRAGREFCRAHRGAVGRAVEEIARLLEEAG